MKGEKWFGMDVKGTLMRYAKAGMMKKRVAEKHGISEDYFNRICKQFDDIPWIDGRHTGQKAHVVLWKGKRLSIGEHARNEGIPPTTAQSRHYRGDDLKRVFRPVSNCDK